MLCEIYGSGTSTHYAQIVGHVADDGNVYHSRPGEVGAENLDRCAGHIASDGNVYSTARGFGESAYQCVGHIGADGRIYDVSRTAGEASGHCVGHIEPDGRVYDTAGPAGLNHCVGQVRGDRPEQGAAALLLLLKGNAASSGSTAASGGATRPVPATVYASEAELLKALAFRFVLLTVIAAGAGMLLSDRDTALSAAFGLLVGTGLALLTTIGSSSVHYRFDTFHCKNGLLRVLLRRQVLFGLAAPLLMLACAALILLSCLSGSAALPASIAVVAAAAALGAWAGTMIRRRRKKK